jgi:hypothetical protein
VPKRLLLQRGLIRRGEIADGPQKAARRAKARELKAARRSSTRSNRALANSRIGHSDAASGADSLNEVPVLASEFQAAIVVGSTARMSFVSTIHP